VVSSLGTLEQFRIPIDNPNHDRAKIDAARCLGSTTEGKLGDHEHDRDKDYEIYDK
jgi:hypothetical protein